MARTMQANGRELAALVAEIRACRICRDAPRGRAAAARAAPGAAAQRDGAHLHLEPGARRARACLGYALHRSLGRPAAGVARARPRGFLRPAPRRHRAHGLLLSRPRCRRRRPAAAPRVRAGLARAPVRGHAAAGADPGCGQLRPALAPWRDGRREHDRHGQALARAARGQGAAAASCPCRIPPGATTPGSPPTRGSRGSCCRACAARSAS